MKKNYKSFCVEDTKKIANNFSKTLKPKDLILLYGDLGAGKTIVAKEISKFFGVKLDVVSPTFNILKVYKTNNKQIKFINHFDLYRIKKADELLDIDFNDYLFQDNAITIIEWPDVGEEYYLSKSIIVNIYKKNNENEREIEIIK